MESDPRAELSNLDDLAQRATAAAGAYPVGASVLLTFAELVLVGVFIFVGLSTPMVVAWIVFLVGFHLVLRSRRRARPRAPWATPGGRRRLKLSVEATLALNAVWIPLFFFARPVALGLLVVALLASLVSTLRFRHA